MMLIGAFFDLCSSCRSGVLFNELTQISISNKRIKNLLILSENFSINDINNFPNYFLEKWEILKIDKFAHDYWNELVVKYGKDHYEAFGLMVDKDLNILSSSFRNGIHSFILDVYRLSK